MNKFRHGCLVMKLPDSEAATIPTVLFGTINGTIGVLASLPQEQFKFLERLQVPALPSTTSQHPEIWSVVPAAQDSDSMRVSPTHWHISYLIGHAHSTGVHGQLWRQHQ